MGLQRYQRFQRKTQRRFLADYVRANQPQVLQNATLVHRAERRRTTVRAVYAYLGLVLLIAAIAAWVQR